MKKIYLQPAVKVVNVQIQNVMQAVSNSMTVGDSWSSGEAASRGGSWDDEE